MLHPIILIILRKGAGPGKTEIPQPFLPILPPVIDKTA
jgi:hypothetical protein